LEDVRVGISLLYAEFEIAELGIAELGIADAVKVLGDQ
jgi:hypothetical protein